MNKKKGIVASVTAAAIVLSSVLLSGGLDSRCGWRHCQPKPTPTVIPSRTPIPTLTIAPTFTIAPTTNPTSTIYTLDEEFNGTSLGSLWQHNYSCCGVARQDKTLSTVSNGYLHQQLVNRNGVWYGDNIDTKNTFTQTYGFYEARIKIAKGKGLWPAFWLYNGTFGVDGDEIDMMEICANPDGQNGGNDVTYLHQTVHKGTASNQIWNPNGDVHGDLSLDWHTYAVDWRPTYLAFDLDGKELWRESSLLISTPKQVMFDFGVGGSWCSAPDSTTPTNSEMLVDWLHVKP